ncbi:MAG: hypothetical protein ACRDDF_04360 [Aeromonas sp.]
MSTEQKFYEQILTKGNYKDLSSVKADEKMVQVIEWLKEDYIKTATKPRAVFGKEVAELLNHSEQSEILGKLIMLCHEYGGFKLVTETITELNFKIQDLAIERMLDLERQLGGLENGK